MNKEISNDYINQFIDGELDIQEENRINELIKLNPSLSDRVDELRRVRSLFRLAFEETGDDTAAGARPNRTGKVKIQAAVFAAILLTGAILGWFSHMQFVFSPSASDVAQNMFAVRSVQDKAVGETRIVLHISHADPKSINVALQGAERLLMQHKRQNKPLALEILVNASNLSLVRADNGVYKNRIQLLQSRYPNLKIVACSATIKKQGRPELLPGVIVGPSARQQIINRLKQGWGYIQA